MATARVGLRSQAVLGLGVVVLLVLCVLGVRVLRAQDQAAPQPVPPASPTAALAARGSAAADPSSAPSAAPGTVTATTATLTVHVVGQVRHPGVVQLASGARVQEAVRAAGGALAAADLAGVNLARVLVDGEQVLVPRPGDAAAPVAGPSSPAAPSGASNAVIDLNSADLTQLDSLPGVGPVLAQRILDWRTANGRFTSVDELGEVSGIGDAVLGRLRQKVRV